ncbi:MAG: hypothetical protein IJ282_02805 [Lachnospiraceae bacterium]|nr:hypothetical protein [Lachnospiraceae bacterium]
MIKAATENKKIEYEKIAAIIALVLLICCLVPVMWVGHYNHPVGDDFYYGVDAHLVWEETGNIFETIAEACKGVVLEYNRWQGTYSAMFLFYMAPNVFSEKAYGFVATIMLSLLTGGIFYFLKPLVCKIAGAGKWLWCIISSVLTLLCVQNVPSQAETFFWYNGSVYYTGFFALTLVFWGMVIRYLLSQNHWYLPGLWVLAIILAGGNYVSLLPAMILLFCLLGALVFFKKKKFILGISGTFLWMMVGFVVSAMAPGNAIRQSDMWQIPAWKAIAKSLLQGVRYVFAWTDGWWFLAALILIPFMWMSYGRLQYRFKYPFIVIGFTYGIFCSMSCPLFYTMNSTGPARAVAIVYYAYVLSTFFCLYYFLGYIHRILTEKNRDMKKIDMFAWAGLPVLLFVILIASGNSSRLTTVKAIGLLHSGEAKAYHQEFLERLEILQDETVLDVEFEAYKNRPDMLYVGDFHDDPEHFNNQKVAEFYHKNTVRVKN